MVDRREFVAAVAGAGVMATANAQAQSAARRTPFAAGPVDLSGLRGKPWLDRERASAFMRREGLDAIVCARAANIFHLTSHWPLLDRMGASGSAFAVLPVDAKAPIALIMGQFSYYYGVSDDGLPAGIEPYLYSGSAPQVTRAGVAAQPVANAEPAAAEARIFRVIDPAALQPRERARRTASDGAAPYSANAQLAVTRALRAHGIRGGTLGADDWLASDMIEAALPSARIQRAEDTLRRIRRVKTPNELQLMRLVAQTNADAALAAAHAARELRTARALRARYYSEATARGMRPVFMVVDGITSDDYDEPLHEGQGVLIDCVSSLLNYNGDFARTIFIGEPSTRMAMATRAIAECWDAVRAALRPGMSYSDIRSLGQALLQKMNYDVHVGITPHSVGLWHGDDPRAGIGGAAQELTLEAGMVLSVDFPVFDQGAGGTAHLEDLSVITATGAELLNSSTQRTISV